MNEAWKELNNKEIDEYSIKIALSYISTLLNTSERFYSRQFDSRRIMCNQLASDFFAMLKTHYKDSSTINIQPSVFYFAEKLNVTANYLGDVIKYYSGKSALNLIHEFIIEEAKILLMTSSKNVSEISYRLGFEYPTYFSRLFKKKTNISPLDYRKSVKSI